MRGPKTVDRDKCQSNMDIQNHGLPYMNIPKPSELVAGLLPSAFGHWNSERSLLRAASPMFAHRFSQPHHLQEAAGR